MARRQRPRSKFSKGSTFKVNLKALGLASLASLGKCPVLDIGNPVTVSGVTGLQIIGRTNKVFISRQNSFIEVRNYLTNKNYFGNNP